MLENEHAIERKNFGIQITWPDGFSSFYHYLWLRDCCYCETCGNGYSSNRLLHPSDIPLDISPKEIDLTDQYLNIIWNQQAHRSQYELGWLRRHSYSDQSRLKRFHRPTLWDASISTAVPKVDFEQSIISPDARLDLFRKLRDYGFVVVRGSPADENGLERVANLIGEIAESAYGKFFDLSPHSKIKTLGNTTSAVPPHTDEAFRHNPPGINILHCIRPAQHGGETVLVDGFKLGEVLRESDPQGFDLLVKQPQPYHRINHDGDIDQRSRGPIFVLDDNNTIVGFRFHPRAAAPFDVPGDLFLKVYAANHGLCKLMFDEKYQAKFKLEAGDAVMFDNQRVMHSRNGFSDQTRKLKICNVSRESFHEQLRLTAAKLGFIDESEQILTAGVSG